VSVRQARRPFVFVNIAITADGKIAPADRRFVPFSSRRDQERMLELRTQADAVLSGARTVDLGDATLGPGGKKYRARRLEDGRAEFNLRVVASGRATIDPKARIFDHRFSPLILLTSSQAPKSRLAKLRFDDVFVSPGPDLDFGLAFEWLREKWRVRRLLCEGGGELNAPLFRERLVDELHLTIAPVVFGGRTAPTLADGDGIESLADVTPLRLRHRELVGEEIYCIYRLAR
jgi:2,5-diamino-6-(ribosylamino)-4(3H)-pyrimidinone 5'-phosphate reductase